MINYNRKHIFIHIYKTAGTSIREKLGNIKGANDIYAPKTINQKITQRVHSLLPSRYSSKLLKSKQKNTQLWKHAGAMEYKQLLGESYSSFFKFSFVRNPFDWQVSTYEYIKMSSDHRLHDFCNEITFKDFLLSQVGECMRSQSDFLYNKQSGELEVDFIGRVENIEEDWSRLSEYLEENLEPLNRLNKSLRIQNLAEYYDHECVELVKSRFKSDFMNFGYSTYLP